MISNTEFKYLSGKSSSPIFTHFFPCETVKSLGKLISLVYSETEFQPNK